MYLDKQWIYTNKYCNATIVLNPKICDCSINCDILLVFLS